MSHFPGGPSGAARRNQCPQSVSLEQQFPEDADDTAAREGEAAHWACAEQLAGRLVDVGVIAPNGVVLTDEMCDAADMMLDDVTKTLAPFGVKPSQGAIEQPVRIDTLYPGMFGTPDYAIVLPGRPLKLFLWDFKFGHRFVPAFENPQLVDYIAGVVGPVPDLDPGVEIVARIVQPRAFHGEGAIREWRTTLLDCRALMNVSRNALAEAYGANPRARAGSECRDCRARHACVALQEGAYVALDAAKATTVMEMPVKALALERKMLDEGLKLMEARLSGLDAQIERLIKVGAQVPGYRLEHGYGRESWKLPADQVVALGSMFGLNLAKPLAPITPNQARDLGLDPTIVAAASQRPRAAAKLVEDDGTKWRRVFG